LYQDDTKDPTTTLSNNDALAARTTKQIPLRHDTVASSEDCGVLNFFQITQESHTHFWSNRKGNAYTHPRIPPTFHTFVIDLLTLCSLERTDLHHFQIESSKKETFEKQIEKIVIMDAKDDTEMRRSNDDGKERMFFENLPAGLSSSIPPIPQSSLTESISGALALDNTLNGNRSSGHLLHQQAPATGDAPQSDPQQHHPPSVTSTEHRTVLQPPPNSMNNSSHSQQQAVVSSNVNDSTPKKARAGPLVSSISSQQQASPTTGSSVINPTPLRHARNTNTTAPSPGSHIGVPPNAYGWLPGGSPPHYHHHMHVYHHQPGMYASPDPNWSKGSANSNSNVAGASGNQHQPPAPPPIPYGWPPHHMAAYPYPHPHHPYPGSNNNGNRYPQAPHLYAWPPPQPPPSVQPQLPLATLPHGNNKSHTAATARITVAPKPSNAILPNNNNNKSPIGAKYKMSVLTGSNLSILTKTAKFGGTSAPTIAAGSSVDDDRYRNKCGGALSPTEIDIHHRDEIQDMGCTCKKTRCLKLYCQCFGAKLYCGINCRCLICYNTKKHEKHRKDAMRNILSRNPAAFDTKFKKDSTVIAAAPKPTTTSATIATKPDPQSPNTTTSAMITNSDTYPTETPIVDTITNVAASTATTTTPTDASRVLAHRLGCKCRKSACMKKVRSKFDVSSIYLTLASI
jgi:Tesmin/TSO1-like CXC domain, cysteine-rich domain